MATPRAWPTPMRLFFLSTVQHLLDKLVYSWAALSIRLAYACFRQWTTALLLSEDHTCTSMLDIQSVLRCMPAIANAAHHASTLCLIPILTHDEARNSRITFNVQCLALTLGASALIGTETPCSRTSSGLTAADGGLTAACGLAEGARCGCTRLCRTGFGSGAAGRAGRANSAAPCTPGGGGPVVLQAVHAPPCLDHSSGIAFTVLARLDTPITRQPG